MEVKFISLKVIIDRIMTSPLYYGLKFDTAIMWAVDCINLLEIPEFFVMKPSKIYIDEYRGSLPYDYITIVKANLIDSGNGAEARKAMKTSSDPFLKGYPNRTNMDNREVELDYRIEGDYIYTGLENGLLEISYKALPVDGDGYIMIPNNTFIIQAVECFIKLKYLTILWELDEVAYDKVEKMDKDYCWAVGQAQSQRQFDNLDKLESVKNAISRLVLLKNFHETDYRYTTGKEYRRI